MSRADEKKAFGNMLAEIEDSDEEDNFKVSAVKAEPKNYYDNRAQSKGATNPPQYKPQQSATYKMSKEEQDLNDFDSQAAANSAEMQSNQIGMTKQWLTRPCSKGERSTVKCYVERERLGFGFQTVYRCFLEAADGTSPGRFMMSAKKHVVKKTSYYLVSLDMNPENDRGSDSVLGKVRGNAVGSKYIITDHGLPPEKTVAPSMLRKEHGVVSFEFDSGGPSRIETWIPYVSPSGMVTVWQPDQDNKGMESKIDQKDYANMFFLVNKVPKWDEAHKGHVLNFQGRVTESSVKNFQLRCAELEDPDEVILQFGRVGKHKFTMDYKYPLSPFQAFSLCVCCLDGKIADRKGYEYLKKLTTGGSSSGSNNNNNNNRESSNNSGASNDNMNNNGENDDDSIENGQKAQGSMSGTTSWRDSLPSSQYLRDKITRTFK